MPGLDDNSDQASAALAALAQMDAARQPRRIMAGQRQMMTPDGQVAMPLGDTPNPFRDVRDALGRQPPPAEPPPEEPGGFGDYTGQTPAQRQALLAAGARMRARGPLDFSALGPFARPDQVWHTELGAVLPAGDTPNPFRDARDALGQPPPAAAPAPAEAGGFGDYTGQSDAQRQALINAAAVRAGTRPWGLQTRSEEQALPVIPSQRSPAGPPNLKAGETRPLPGLGDIAFPGGRSMSSDQGPVVPAVAMGGPRGPNIQVGNGPSVPMQQGQWYGGGSVAQPGGPTGANPPLPSMMHFGEGDIGSLMKAMYPGSNFNQLGASAVPTDEARSQAIHTLLGLQGAQQQYGAATLPAQLGFMQHAAELAQRQKEFETTRPENQERLQDDKDYAEMIKAGTPPLMAAQRMKEIRDGRAANRPATPPTSPGGGPPVGPGGGPDPGPTAGGQPQNSNALMAALGPELGGMIADPAHLPGIHDFGSAVYSKEQLSPGYMTPARLAALKQTMSQQYGAGEVNKYLGPPSGPLDDLGQGLGTLLRNPSMLLTGDDPKEWHARNYLRKALAGH